MEQHPAITMSPTVGRLEFIRRMVAEIEALLASLRAVVEGEVSRGIMKLLQASYFITKIRCVVVQYFYY